MPYDLIRLRADVAQVQHRDAGFGTGRLVAENLILTAAHVLWKSAAERKEGVAARLDGWEVRLARDYRDDPWHLGNRVLWHDPVRDLALLQLLDSEGRPLSPPLRPGLRLRVAKVSGNNLHLVEARGYPRASKELREGEKTVSRKLLPAFGRLSATGPREALLFGIDTCDLPDDPRVGWLGMSGSAVLLREGSDPQVIWVYGVVQEVPANFNGQLRVAPLSDAWQRDLEFRKVLVNAGASDEEADDPTNPPLFLSRSGTLVPVPSESAPIDYVRRPEVTDTLIAYLLDTDQAPSGRAMISAVHGMGGVGKSTVARWLIWQREIERRFPDGRIWVSLGNKAWDELAVLEFAASQLGLALVDKQSPNSAKAALATLLQNKSVLFVIDDVWPKSLNAARALLVPSPQSRFLLTTRFPQFAGLPEIRAKNFPLDQMSEQQTFALVKTELGRKLTEAEVPLVQRLWKAVGGHPLAIKLAAIRVKKGRAWDPLLADLTAEIARLEVLDDTRGKLLAKPLVVDVDRKEQSVRASLSQSLREISTEAQQLFAWLGVASEEAMITSPMAATLWSKDVEEASDYLSELADYGFLRVTDGEVTGYRVHSLMHDMARDLLTGPKIPAQQGDLPGLGLTLERAAQHFLRRYCLQLSNGLWHTVPKDNYIHAHLVQHLEQANWREELKALLLEQNEEGYCGWYAIRESLGQTAGFFTDVSRIWEHSDREASSDANERRPGAVSSQVHCALISASLSSASADIPIETLSAATRCGLMSCATGLLYARQHTDPRSRVEAIMRLITEFPDETTPGLLSEALTSAFQCKENESRALMLAAVAAKLLANQRRGPAAEALSAAKKISIPELQASTFIGISEHLEREATEEALATTSEVVSLDVRIRLLLRLVPLLQVESQPALLFKILCTVLEIGDIGCSDAIADVLSQFPVSEVWDSARGINDASRRAKLLVEIWRGLHEQERDQKVDEVLRAVREIGDAQQRMVLLAKLAPASQEPYKAPAIYEALLAAQQIADSHDREDAISLLVRRLPHEELTAAARHLEDASMRTILLTRLALVPGRDQQNLFAEAASTAAQIPEAATRAEVLIGMLAGLPNYDRNPIIAKALHAANQIPDESVRDRMVSDLLKHVPQEERPQNLVDVRSIDVASVRAREFTRIAKWLPVHQRAEPLKEALLAASAIYRPKVRDEIVEEVVRMGSVQQALTLAFSIPQRQSRWEIISAIVKQAQHEETLRAARSIDGKVARAEALTAVAALLPFRDRLEVLREALDVARQIGDSSSLVTDIRWRSGPPVGTHPTAERPKPKAEVFDKIVQSLPLDQARAVAHSIDEPLARSWAVVACARRLALSDLMGVVNQIEEPEARFVLLFETLAEAPSDAHASVLGMTISTVRHLKVAEGRATGLAMIADHLLGDHRRDVLGEALTAALEITDPHVRRKIIAAVAENRPKDMILSAIRATGNTEVIIWAAIALRERLPEILESEFLGLAMKGLRTILAAKGGDMTLAAMQSLPASAVMNALASIVGHEARDEAVAMVIPKLDKPQVLVLMGNITDPDFYSAVFSAMEERLTSDERDQFRRQPAGSLDSAYDRDKTSAGPDHEAQVRRRRAFDGPLSWRPTGYTEMSALRRQAPDVNLGEIQAYRVSTHQATYDEALLEQRTFSGQREPLVAPRTVVESEVTPLPEPAWVSSFPLSTRAARERASMEMVRRLTAAQALAALRRVSDAELRTAVVSAIAFELPIGEARIVSDAIGNATDRARMLTALSERLSPPDAVAMLGEALNSARDIDDANVRVDTVVGIARRLPVCERATAAREGLNSARTMMNIEERVRSLLSVCWWLPIEEQPDVLGEALLRAAQVDDAQARVALLSEVSGRSIEPPSKRFLEQWSEGLHILAMRGRRELIADLSAVAPVVQAIGGEQAATSLENSLRLVPRWWS